ncbi:hypothetical protein C8R42DRAFT_124002 [Lentinula raphanica]|nr:hypothetical protein C8R42DRAFT_124002 [Lentinula raphanica]
MLSLLLLLPLRLCTSSSVVEICLLARCLFHLTIFLSITNANAQTKAASLKPVETLKAAYNDATPLAPKIQNATCEAGFDWANNAAGFSPCVMAAAAVACNTAHIGHNVPPLIPGSHYDPPSLANNTVNVCQCSWAAYNLISMCTLCQGEIYSLFLWEHYITECDDFTQNNSYFPSSYEPFLPLNYSIPYYAQTDPTQWFEGVFNITQAKGLADGTLSLQSPVATHNSNTTPVAAIVGGSVGVAVVLLCFLGVIIWMRRRRSRAATRHQNISTPSNRHCPMSAAVMNGTDRAPSDAGIRDGGYFSRIFTSESGSTVRNSQIPRPYTKSYSHSLSDDSTVYTRQNDVLPVPRPPVYTNSHAQGSQAPGHLWQIGRYSSAPYTAVPTIVENVPRSTSSSRRPDSPPPYEAVIADSRISE